MAAVSATESEIGLRKTPLWFGGSLDSSGPMGYAVYLARVVPRPCSR